MSGHLCPTPECARSHLAGDLDTRLRDLEKKVDALFLVIQQIETSLRRWD